MEIRGLGAGVLRYVAGGSESRTGWRSVQWWGLADTKRQEGPDEPGIGTRFPDNAARAASDFIGGTRGAEAFDGAPLVTFVVFAYNQEQYIREAVEGAFAQTYEPLEIILSDDCSTDRSFEIMQEMAAAYEGPHEVRVRQSEVNFGTALHVYAVASSAKGELIVVAAGDDVSVPTRTALLVDAWIKAGKPIATVHSNLLTVSQDEPRGIARKPRSDSSDEINLAWYIRNLRLPFYSQTCAYSKALFEAFPPILGGSLIEDGVLATRCFLIGRFIHVDACLVRQRITGSNAGSNNSFRNPDRWNRIIRSRMISRSNGLQDIASAGAFTPETKKLEDLFTKQAKRLGTFILPESRFITPLERSLIFLRILWQFPTRGPLLRRLTRAMVFLELEKTPMIKKLRAQKTENSARRHS